MGRWGRWEISAAQTGEGQWRGQETALGGSAELQAAKADLQETTAPWMVENHGADLSLLTSLRACFGAAAGPACPEDRAVCRRTGDSDAGQHVTSAQGTASSP